MAGMFGLDVEQVLATARQFDQKATKLREISSSTSALVTSGRWVGPDGDKFRNHWLSTLRPMLDQAAESVSEAGERLRANALDQQRTSLEDGGSGSSANMPQLKALPVWPNSDLPAGHESISDIVSGMNNMNSEEDGISVQTVIGPDGEVRHIVHINGSGSVPSAWWDPGRWWGELGWVEGNTQGIYGQEGQTYEHFRDQIQAAIGDSDGEIMLVGFSQGGMWAQHLASDPSLNVTNVITYGSPTVNTDDNYGGASVLRLGHSDDIVPMISQNAVQLGIEMIIGRPLMGAVPPPSVLSPSFLGGLVGPGYGPTGGDDVVSFWSDTPPTGAAHSTDNYASVADEFSNVNSPEAQAIRDSISNFYGPTIDYAG